MHKSCKDHRMSTNANDNRTGIAHFNIFIHHFLLLRDTYFDCQ